MFTLFAIAALLFGGAASWILFDACRGDMPVKLRDWLSAAAIAGGSLATMATALKVLFG